jgi:hypothetical protein
MKLKRFIAGVAGALVISTAAAAADPIVIASPSPAPMFVAPASFDWSGLHVGVSTLTALSGGGGSLGLINQVGANFQRGNFVFGAEIQILTVLGGGGFALGTMADAGIALGPTDRILLYGTGGVLYTPGSLVGFLLGGGAAFATGDRMSLFSEVLYVPGQSCCFLRAGVNFAVR